MGVTRLHHAVPYVSDVDRGIAVFYCDVLAERKVATTRPGTRAS